MPDPESPPTIFSPDDPVETLWIQAYQGEILGELLFAGIADQVTEPDQARKMGVLAMLERRTGQAMIPALERAGIPTGPDPETVQLAEALIEGTRADSWAGILGSFESITTQFLAVYRRIGELAPAERDTADLLVAHELALGAFARRELAGDGAGSLSAIEALPHMA